jgi:hypothetical protein
MQGLRQHTLCERRELGAAEPAHAEEAKAASEWLQDAVTVYVINAPERLAHWQAMVAQLEAFHLRFHRVWDVSVHGTADFQAAQRADLIPRSFSFNRTLLSASEPIHRNSKDLFQGALGHVAAHLAALRQAQESTTSTPLAFVIQDDVVLASDFPVRLQRLLTGELPCEWDVVSLRSECPYGLCVSPHLLRVLPDANEPEGRCRKGTSLGQGAMLYNVATLGELRTKLESVVWNETRPSCIQVDVALASIADQVAYYAVPAVQHPGFLTAGASQAAALAGVMHSTAPMRLSSARAEPAAVATTTSRTTAAPALDGLFPSGRPL